MITDYLIKLYDLPSPQTRINEVREADPGIEMRRALQAEKQVVLAFVRENFNLLWADEVEAAFHGPLVTCFIATKDEKVIGFVAYEAIAKAFLGPSGINEPFRGQGIGTVLLHCGLQGLKELGYTYAVVPAAPDSGYYEKQFGAILIADSFPGFYKGMLRHDEESELRQGRSK